MLFHSHVNYCNIVWGFTTKKNIERIHKLQKRGIRIITHSPYVSSIPLFLKKWKFYLLVTWYLCKLHYSCLDYVTTFYLKYLTIILLWIVPSIITNKKCPKYSSPIESHVNNTIFYFYYHGSILWNNIQTWSKSSKTVKQFKRLYKQFLFDAMYHST